MADKCGKVKEEFGSENILLEEKLKAVKAEAEGLKILLEEKDGTITALLAINETLERQNRRFEMDFSAKMAMEAGEQEVEEKLLELIRKIEVLEERKGKLEAENCKLKEDTRNEAEKICNVNKAFEVEKINELVKWIGVSDRDKEAEKMSMEEEGKKIVLKLTHRIEVLERETRETEANFRLVNREKSEEINRILNEKTTMEAESKKKVMELVRRVEVLEKEKREIEPIAWSEEIERILTVVASRSVGGIDEPEKKLKVIETEPEAIKSFLKEKLLALTWKIQVVEREKAQLEVESCKLKEDNKSEAEKVRKLNKALETEKKRGETAREKILELVERVKEAQKREMEAKVCEAKQNKIEEIHRIPNEKKILELVNRNDLLEREKRGFEAEIAERDEVIKVLAQEKCCFKDKKKELEMEMEIIWLASKPMEDVQLSQHAHLIDNVVMFGTPQPNVGQYSAGVANSTELNGSINHDAQSGDGKYEDELTHTNGCKRKRSIRKWENSGKKFLKCACEDVVDVKPVLLPCQKNKEMNTTRCTNGSNKSDVQVVSRKIACEWEVEQDVLDAFDVYPELCLKAVCALYRQNQRLGHSTNTALSSEGIAYAVYLMSEDPEGRKTKKMVAKLDELDRDAVGKCMNIAKQHYKKVFEIYKKSEDPVFLS